MSKNTGIALANELAEAGRQGIMDIDVLMLGSEIVHNASELSKDELGTLLFKYTATLSAAVSARISHVLLTETQMADMASEIDMFDKIAKDVLGN